MNIPRQKFIVDAKPNLCWIKKYDLQIVADYLRDLIYIVLTFLSNMLFYIN